ncbi:septal ring lytic transglycosylase RlpA family protein [Candidatus Gracilibacteria bacterium]|nr:septal ring lytic transglycosylase RlpA family protein [Candidatus Gracilibacteria bacterium]
MRKNIAKWLLIPLSIVLSIAGIANSEEAPSPEPFSDVEEDDYHYVAIKSLREMGIIDGYEDNTFRSHEKINRAEALKMITLASGAISGEPNEISEDPFTDTPAASWYSPYLAAAKEIGIIDGYDDGSFQPEKNINLAEALKIYLESFPNLSYPDPNLHLFADTPIDAWYTPYTSLADSREMLEIHPTNEIYPSQEISRGYLAEIIYKLLKFSDGYHFGKATFYGKALQGNFTASGEIFDYFQLTAAHKELPFGTMVKVTNLANNKSITVEITDRGPYGPGRVIDLTTTAFEEIAWIGWGIINVQYQIIEQ